MTYATVNNIAIILFIAGIGLTFFGFGMHAYMYDKRKKVAIVFAFIAAFGMLTLLVGGPGIVFPESPEDASEQKGYFEWITDKWISYYPSSSNHENRCCCKCNRSDEDDPVCCCEVQDQ